MNALTVKNRTKSAIILVMCMITSITFAQYRKHENKAFEKGEQLVYRIHYGVIDAGVAEIDVRDAAAN